MLEPIDTWLSVVAGGAVVALAWALVWSVPAIYARRNDLADVLWGPTFVWIALLVGGITLLPDPGSEPRAVLVLVLLTAWAARLAWHIGRRFLSHAEEDRRYARWREQWGSRWIIRSILQVWVLQALIALVVAQPVLIAVAVHDGPSALGVLDAIAALVVLGGLVLEATADRQLRTFLARRADGSEQQRYLTTGVWSWSRHPNYAGDSILWWGLGLFGIAGALDAGAPGLVVPALVGPAVMFAFLRWGSGVPLTERGRTGHHEWDAYVARTSAFLPRPPRRSA